MLPVQVSEWNETEVEYPRDLTVAQIFGLQAARTPEAIAVVAGDCRLSYRELDAWSNRLARYLQSLGVKPETLVGVALGRCASIIVSLLAILKAGGAYVPLDPNHPKDRLSLVIEDSHMPVLITGAEARGQLPSAACRLMKPLRLHCRVPMRLLPMRSAGIWHTSSSLPARPADPRG